MRTIQAITAQSLLFSFSYAFCSSSPRQSYPWTIGVGDVVAEVDYSSKGTSSLISGDAEDKVELKHSDPEVYNLVTSEVRRQRYGLELIASENFCSKAVREALGSCFTNKYSEGNVGKRYYGGNQYVDELEQLCMDRALDLFDLNTEEWGVNVQPYSGSPANFAVYTAMLQPHDRIMGLDLPSGGHLTHGFQTASGKKVSATSIYFESMPYVVSQETGLIDYDDMLYRAKMFRPSILIAGGSAYPREWDYARMKNIADEVGALLMVDMAHISGLVAAGVVDSPFAYADIVTSTTHKTLRGPRSGMIFARRSCEKRNGDDLMKAIDAAVFPALQGGPHNNQIAALAVALREAKSDSFREYAEQVLCNAQTLAQGLIQRGHKIATNGTDNHLLLWDLRPMGIAGSRLEKALEMASITANKNSLAGDTSAINPGGVRLGTPALTSRGLRSKDFEMVADFLHRAFEISIEAQQLATERSNGKKVLLKDYVSALESMESIRQLREEVEEFSSGFYMPGGDERYITSD